MAQDQFKRKLTTILSSDVACYSRLMGDDEAATVKTLKPCIKGRWRMRTKQLKVHTFEPLKE
jgi:adenylate cyclase